MRFRRHHGIQIFKEIQSARTRTGGEDPEMECGAEWWLVVPPVWTYLQVAEQPSNPSSCYLAPVSHLES